MTYSQQSKLHAAVSSLRTGLALKCGYAEGDDAQNHSNLLFILSHLDPADPERLFEEHRRFAENFENSATWPQHTNSKDPIGASRSVSSPAICANTRSPISSNPSWRDSAAMRVSNCMLIPIAPSRTR
jgi:hypothetical protein